MNCTFLNAAGVVQFVRGDMESGRWTQEEYSVNATFPFNRDKLITRGMRISFRDPATDIMEFFEVRNVTNIEPDAYQQIIAEHIVVSELSDDHINNAEITDKTPAQALTTVLTGTLWAVGNASVTDVGSVDISRGSVWQAVKAIEQGYNCYIEPRVTVNTSGAITGRYLDIVAPTGTFRGLRLSIQKNMSESSVVYDDSEVYTALYGYGGSVDVPQSGGAQDEREELTFADVVWTATSEHPAKPDGQTYIEDPAATALYGRNGRPRYGYYQNSDIKDAEVLLENTWEALKQARDPKISITGTVSDFYRMGMPDVPVRLHDIAIVDVTDTGETFSKQVIQNEIDLVDPTATNPTIGDYIPNIIYINRETDEKAGGGGGGGGGHGQTNIEHEDGEIYTEWLNLENKVGMVVGTYNGGYKIEAGEIALSINEQTGESAVKISGNMVDINGSSITISADRIDINGLVTKLLTEQISCASIHTTSGSNLFEGHCSFPDTVNIVDLTMLNGALTYGADAVTWQDTEVVTGTSVTTAGARWYASSTDGTTITGTNYFNPVTVVSATKTTIHYLGKAAT